MHRIYLYGIINNGHDVSLNIPGVDDISPVHIVQFDGLGGVVSDYKGEDFRALSKEKLVRSLLAHQHVVEAVMRHETILPVKFGTLLDNLEEVGILLSQGHSEFITALTSIQDKVEIEMAATWNINQVLQELSREAQVVQFKEAISRKGQPTVEERIQLGQVVKACLDKRRDIYRQRVMSFLQPLSINIALHALVSEEMVMNIAFLTEQVRLPQLYEAVHQVDQLFQNQITFRVIGPLPPYSFSTVEITHLTPEQVEAARRALHLENALSEVEVRKAYRHLAASNQHNFKSGEQPMQFAQLRQSSELLLSYCRACEESARDRHQVQTSRDTEPLFFIAIKGSRGDEVEPARFGGSVRV